jgi:hypothetical protein
MTANEVTSADGGWRVLFAFFAQWPAAAEFCCSTARARSDPKLKRRYDNLTAR